MKIIPEEIVLGKFFPKTLKSTKHKLSKKVFEKELKEYEKLSKKLDGIAKKYAH